MIKSLSIAILLLTLVSVKASQFLKDPHCYALVLSGGGSKGVYEIGALS